MRSQFHSLLVVAMLSMGGGLCALAARPQPAAPAAAAGAPLANGKAITPAGRQTHVGSFPANLVLSPDGKFVVAANTGYRQFVSVLSAADGRLLSQLGFNGERRDGSRKKEGLYFGLAFGGAAAGKTTLYVSRGAEDRVSILTLDADGRLADTGRAVADPSPVPDFKSPRHVAGLALSTDGSRLYAVNNNTGPLSGMKGSLSILDPAGGRAIETVELPGFPYAVAAVTRGDQRDRKVYVSSERDAVVAVVDPGLVPASRRGRAGPASLGRTVPVGAQPIAMLLNRAQTRLFVANAGSDTVSVIDTASDRLRQTIPLRPEGLRGIPGATPTGLALAPDETRLYVTLADMNALAVVDLAGGRLAGYVPVGWYPTAVVAAADGKQLFVANAKGVNARNPNSVDVGSWGRHVQNIIEGTVATIPAPDAKALEAMTAQTLANQRYSADLQRPPHELLRNPGIEHVIYIIKENRTYDQVLGDLPQGNGMERLCLFPREVTPNHHALAERFVLLDNFYCAAEVSADGWNWSTSGMAGEYVARNTPYSYSQRGRAYDYEGQNNGVSVDLKGIPDVARAPGGYLWDLFAGKGLSFRNYGFFTSLDGSVPDGSPVQAGNTATKRALEGKTDLHYLRFDMTYADSDAWVIHQCPSPLQQQAFGEFKAPSRFAEWKREFDAFVRDGNLPSLQMVRLPRDHTAGTSPGASSPRAMVADNDYALGQLVEAVSRSPYWKKTAIFVVEDDAQNGFDHVDAHRSIAFVISPFVARETVDHRFYNTDSVLRTIELLFELPPMCQYDAVATPFRIFNPTPENDAPYAAILPAKAIPSQVNARTAYRARDSQGLDFSREDAVPDEVLNDILWHAVRGPRSPKPAVRYGLGGGE